MTNLATLAPRPSNDPFVDEDQLPVVRVSAVDLGFAIDDGPDNVIDFLTPPTRTVRPTAQFADLTQPRDKATPPDLNRLPPEMRAARRWLVYRVLPPRKPGGKPRKMPFYANGQARGETDTAADQAQLATLEQALAAKVAGGCTGLGFALGPDGRGRHWQGIDLDELSDHPEWESLIGDLPGYVEYSPSGNGVHAIGFGPAFSNLSSNCSDVEAYCSSRYFTVTADVVRDNGITDLSDFVRTRVAPIHRQGGPAAPSNVDPDWDLGELPDYIKNHQGEGDLQDLIAGIYPDQRLDETPANIALVENALSALPAACGNDPWVKTLWAIASLKWNCGEQLARDWSQTAPDQYDDASFADAWRRAVPHRIGINYLFAAARRQGWTGQVPQSLPDDDETRLAPEPDLVDLETASTDPDVASPLTPLDLTDLLARTIAPPAFVIPYLLPRGHVTLLGGHGGCGKSLVALSLGAHVAAGQPWAHLLISRGRAVYFSFEDGSELLLHRLRMIINAFRLDLDRVLANLRVFDLTEHGPLASEVNDHGTRRLLKTATWESVAATIDGADLVIVDNASDAYDGDENSRRQVRRFIQWLRGLIKPQNGALLLLAHVDKNAAKYGGNNNSYSGSTAWHNSARSRLVIANDQLAQEKLNVGRALETPIDLEWRNGLPIPLQAGALTARLQAQDDTDVLTAITAALQAGQIVNGALTGSNTPWHCLNHEPSLPPELRATAGKKRLHDAISRLATAGTLRLEPYTTRGRRDGFRWVLTTPVTGVNHAQ